MLKKKLKNKEGKIKKSIKILKTIGIAVFLFFIIGLVLPKQYEIERSIMIQAPINRIFNFVNVIKKNDLWSPWYDIDKYRPTDPKRFEDRRIRYNRISAGKGASYRWSSQNYGSGRYTITSSQAPSLLYYKILFEGQQSQEDTSAEGEWRFLEEEKGVKVTWNFRGEVNGILGKYWAFLLSDFFLGIYFEHALERLKEISEK